jgi:hypothetical protein
MIKQITFMTLISLLAIAPQAFAFSGGGGKGGNGPVSGAFGDHTFSGTCNNGECSGMIQPGNGTFDVRLGTPEPFAGLIVGLGLLGARYLRRR